MASRTHKAKLNMSTSFIAQIVSIICGLIVPNLMIRTFGSELYGATTSIAQFLAYISLIEGGIAGVARAALYKPMSIKDYQSISDIYYEIVRFFRIVGTIFVIYTAIIACSYNFIVTNNSLDLLFSAVLVIVISISTLGQYFFGISNSILIQADQKYYIINVLSIITVLLNTIAVVVLTRLGFGIIIVKLIGSLIYILRPLILAFYVKRYYPNVNSNSSNKGTKTNYLNQKWTALGQHIAYFLHSNTDVVVLTILADLKIVAVYSIYNMIISSIRSLTASFYNGLESIFGNMFANKEYDKLNKVFGYYESLISVVAIVFFSTTAIMIVPFVKIYTSGITDTNYILPRFAIIAVFAELIYTLRTPYHYMSNAANRFRETRIAAYGEAFINITLSVLLVFKYGITGVAFATLLATLFRSIYYAIYISRKVLHRSFILYLKRFFLNIVTFGMIVCLGIIVITNYQISNYVIWALFGLLVFLVSLSITLLIHYFFYKSDLTAIVKKEIGK